MFTALCVRFLLLCLSLRRSCFFESNGNLKPLAFQLRKEIAPSVCADGIPWRIGADKKLELMALRRAGGPFPNKLVCVGGMIRFGEDCEEAVRRHFRDDFCAEVIVTKFFDLAQYRNHHPNKRWKHDPGKEHVIALVFFVEFLYDALYSPPDGDTVEWFSKDVMPPESEFGYSNYELYRMAFEKF